LEGNQPRRVVQHPTTQWSLHIMSCTTDEVNAGQIIAAFRNRVERDGFAATTPQERARYAGALLDVLRDKKRRDRPRQGKPIAPQVAVHDVQADCG
jgi:hypothetical protein